MVLCLCLRGGGESERRVFRCDARSVEDHVRIWKDESVGIGRENDGDGSDTGRRRGEKRWDGWCGG